ncbi:MAG: nickel pincer cofactor biosynthesis protein LarB [Planctomycetota bacterium]|jgi:NCAIR mutase (PurE)-related protein|nr:nickel pincer cofactor biosynthesis protein LarB [Planctomycetota bacterium]
MPDAEETHREAGVDSPEGSVVARLDLERLARCGAPEAVFALRKTPEETLAIAETLVERQGYALVTRAEPECMALLRRRWPGIRIASHAGAALAGDPPPARGDGKRIAIVCAGTSDLAVAEETALTLEALGRRGEIVADVGVAGLHRLLARIDDIRRAAVVIAVAGMEGALPSVVAGLIAAPVIAVPTSVGYGASLGGVSALLGMLNSCSPGITVVNIDNGFGAAMAASRMLDI